MLERLVDKGLQINQDKSRWVKDQVEYLGFLLNRDGVEPEPMKIQGIIDMGNPEIQRHVRRVPSLGDTRRPIFHIFQK